VGLVARRLHGDGAAALGLPSLAENRALLARALRAGGRERRTALLFCAALALLLLRGWPNLLARLGLRRHAPELFGALAEGAAALLLPLAAAPLLACALGLFVVRWDNLLAAARALLPGAALLALGLGIAACLAAAPARDAAPLPPGVGLRAQRASEILYLLWALPQQYLGLAYTNTRLRRAVAARSPRARLARGLVAALCGAGFGLLHLPALALGAASAILQTYLAWHFQRAATRNLFAACALHALLGSLYAQLLPLSMDVGPWRD